MDYPQIETSALFPAFLLQMLFLVDLMLDLFLKFHFSNHILNHVNMLIFPVSYTFSFHLTPPFLIIKFKNHFKEIGGQYRTRTDKACNRSQFSKLLPYH
jgi:hypothetical protein